MNVILSLIGSKRIFEWNSCLKMSFCYKLKPSIMVIQEFDPLFPIGDLSLRGDPCLDISALLSLINPSIWASICKLSSLLYQTLYNYISLITYRSIKLFLWSPSILYIFTIQLIIAAVDRFEFVNTISIFFVSFCHLLELNKLLFIVAFNFTYLF